MVCMQEADDTPRGFGFVELCSSAFVQYAIYVMHRTVLFGRVSSSELELISILKCVGGE